MSAAFKSIAMRSAQSSAVMRSALMASTRATAVRTLASTPASSSPQQYAEAAVKNTKRPDYLLKFSSYAKQRNVWHMTSYALAAGIPAALVVGGPIATLVDFTLGVALPLHFHMGMRSVVIDYLSPKPDLQRIALAVLAGVTTLSALGLLKFNVKDVGLTQAVKQLLYEQELPKESKEAHNHEVIEKKHHH